MAVDVNNAATKVAKSNSGLVYDADCVTLTASYGDQLSAYRSRKDWIDILSSYFLLEESRDYEIAICTIEEFQAYQVCCEFVSACGRYAFWRLINHQAPEAERKLGGATGRDNSGANTGAFTSFFATQNCGVDEKLPWVITSDAASLKQSKKSRGIFARVFGLFF